MEKKSNIVRNIAIGVAVGAAVTLLKKENRDKVVRNVRKAKTKMIAIRENPADFKNKVKENVQTISIKGKELTDLSQVKNKVGELKKLTPAVVETLKETRQIFNKKKQGLQEVAEAQTEAASAVETPAELAPEQEPIVAQDGGMAEVKELMLTSSDVKEEVIEEKKTEPVVKKEEKKSEELVGEKKDEVTNEALVGDKAKEDEKKSRAK
jgi:hypothetical protein